MKTHTLIACFLLLAFSLSGQDRNKLRQTWIRIASEDLSGYPRPTDSSYVRYAFTRADLKISVEPGSGWVSREWQLDKNVLTIGEDPYTVETLNDSVLVIFAEGFKRFTFNSETYLSSQEKNLLQIGEFESKPLYLATNFISPRYSDTRSLQRDISDELNKHFDIKKKSLLKISFVVTDKGEVKAVTLESGVYDDFNEVALKLISKTSKKWTPATFKGQAIQTKFTFWIRYLDSINPY